MSRNVAIFAGVVLLVVLAAFLARAHDQYHDWKIPGTTTSCCDNRDCGPTRARVANDGEYWEVLHDGVWLPVMPRAMLPFPSPDGRSHACVIGGNVLCFVPGEIRG